MNGVRDLSGLGFGQDYAVKERVPEKNGALVFQICRLDAERGRHEGPRICAFLALKLVAEDFIDRVAHGLAANGGHTSDQIVSGKGQAY
ncbi:hypothetical protein D3C80_2015640 [compost metagenome]